MTTLEAIQAKQLAFKRGRDRLRDLLKKFRPKPVGKTVGLVIPEDLRRRLLAQSDIWKAHSYRQMVLSCVVMGLDEVEKLGKIQKLAEDRDPVSDPPPSWASERKKDGRPGIKEFSNGIRESFVEEVPEVPRSLDQGDDGVPAPDWDEEDVSR